MYVLYTKYVHITIGNTTIPHIQQKSADTTYSGKSYTSYIDATHAT